MILALAVHLKGFGLALRSVSQVSMAASSSALRLRTPAAPARRAWSQRHSSVGESLACRSCRPAYCRNAPQGIPSPRVNSPHGARMHTDSLVVAGVLSAGAFGHASSAPIHPDTLKHVIGIVVRIGPKNSSGRFEGMPNCLTHPLTSFLPAMARAPKSTPCALACSAVASILKRCQRT